MLGLALLASILLAGPPPALPGPWAGPEESLGHLAGFRVRVDLHGKSADRDVLPGDAIQRVMVSTLRSSGIAVVEPAPGAPVSVHGGALILDVHVLATDRGTALAWTLQASQNAQVLSGAWTFAATWAVGDLLFVPSGDAVDGLRRSLQPALDDFCKAYLSSRPPAPSAGDPPPPSTGL